MNEEVRVPGVNYERANNSKYKATSKDPGWKYAYWPDDNKDKVVCVLCGNENHSGIKRLKEHLIGGFGDVHKCSNTTSEIAKEMREWMTSKATKKKSNYAILDKEEISDDDSNAHDVANEKNSLPVCSSGTTTKRKKSMFQFQKQQSKDPKSSKSIISMLIKSPEQVVDERHAKSKTQTTIENRMRTTAEKERVHMHIADFFYENGISFNVANSRSYEAAGKFLERKYETIFWTPCAAHCLDLILEDIGKMVEFESTISDAKRVTTFIYRHGRVLDALRKLTNRDLVKFGVTRFANAFLTLQSLYKHKEALRQLIDVAEWKRCSASKTENGKKVAKSIVEDGFWCQVEFCIQASQPLLQVLRIVDGDEKPALAEVYGAMEFAKKKIKTSLEKHPTLLQKVISNINERWKSQMGQKIYGAALFLNPGRYFELLEYDDALASQLRSDFNSVLQKLVADRDLRDKISSSVDDYQNLSGEFANEMAKEHLKSKSPRIWWDAYGGGDHELQIFARRIVSLCCSSSGCERNWSTFEFIHSKKRNLLEHQRLNDLVFVQYNRKLESRLKKRREAGKNFDPLILEDLKWSNEWIDAKRDVEVTEIQQEIEDFTNHRTFGDDFDLNIVNTYSHRCTKTITLPLVLDDEGVDDDFGLTASSASGSGTLRTGEEGNGLELDEFD